MYRMLGLGSARAALRAAPSSRCELPGPARGGHAEQVREAAPALRPEARAVLVVEPATQPTEEQA